MNYQTKLRKLGTMENIRMITDTLDQRGRTAIDIGCDAALVAVHLAHLGLSVEAYEPDAQGAKEAREFISANQSTVKFQDKLLSIEDLEKMGPYDVTCFLSVYHQIVSQVSIEYAEKFLQTLYRRTSGQLYLQSCMIHQKHGRRMPFIEGNANSILAYFTAVLRASGEPVHASALGYSQNGLPASEPLRPMFLFEKRKERRPVELPSMARTNWTAQVPSDLLYVEMEHVVSDQTLQSFSREGWHHFTEVCRHLVAKPSDLDGARTILAGYYSRCQPATVGELWARAGATSGLGLLANQPAGHYCNWLPWSRPTDSIEAMRAGRTEASAYPAHDNHAYGPAAADLVDREARRLQGLLQKIGAQGYEPEVNHDGYIRGQILVRGAAAKFVALAGQHRLAVLSALGYQQVIARFQPGRAKVIDLANVAKWPQVANGTFTVAEATTIFNAVFDATGLALRDALKSAPAAVTLPEIKTYRTVSNQENGWSDQYGSLHLAATYAGLTLGSGCRLNAIWQHGCEGPWMDFSPALHCYNAPGAKDRFVLLAREDQAQLLRDAGYAEAHAIGLPIVYTQPSGLARRPRSLLVMPTHTLAGERIADRGAFEKYADEIKAIAGNFDRVVICIHPSCRSNGLWVKEFSSRGFEIIYGAQNTDANALQRVRALCEQFETVTTNGWGSHVAYALAFGAKVAIYGTQPKRTEADYLRDATWVADPAALKKWLSDETTSRERAFLAAYYQTPMQGVANVEQGQALIGWNHRVSPEQMGQLLDIILSTPVSAAREARQQVRQQARVLVNSGAKAEAIQLLVRAVKIDVDSKNPGIILESLVEIGGDLAPLEPKQSGYLLAEAEKLAKSQGLTLESSTNRSAAA